MPMRKARTTTAEGNGIVSCINEMWAYLRSKGAHLDSISDWNLATLQAFRAAGYQAVVYANSNAGGRIDAVCIYGVENHVHPPSVISEPWLCLKIMAVRALTLAEAEHERATLLPLKLVIPEGATQLGCVGLTAEYVKKWQKLHDFLATFTTAEFVDQDVTERIWMRFRDPSLPEFTTRTAGVTE
jgi:hypothetical protein